jgi:predicted nucleic acid-binding protein
MVLIDTSIWIRYLYGQPRIIAEVHRLLATDQALAHELVYGELLIGDVGGRAAFLATYERLHQADNVPHAEVVALARLRRLHGRGAGWIDIHLLASAVVEAARLWTADPRLATLARELGVDYAFVAQG